MGMLDNANTMPIDRPPYTCPGCRKVVGQLLDRRVVVSGSAINVIKEGLCWDCYKPFDGRPGVVVEMSAELTALRAENARLLALLRRVEWGFRETGVCPCCGARKRGWYSPDARKWIDQPETHRPDCELADEIGRGETG